MTVEGIADLEGESTEPDFAALLDLSNLIG